MLAKYGQAQYIAPDFSTKAKAQKLAGVPLAKLVKEKENFRKTLLAEWDKQTLANKKRTPDARDGMTNRSSYSNK